MLPGAPCRRRRAGRDVVHRRLLHPRVGCSSREPNFRNPSCVCLVSVHQRSFESQVVFVDRDNVNRSAYASNSSVSFSKPTSLLISPFLVWIPSIAPSASKTPKNTNPESGDALSLSSSS